MRVAISGTNYMGKTTLIEDFIAKHPHDRCDEEPYDKLQYEQSIELALEPSLDRLLEELDYGIERLNECKNEANVIFDRCSSEATDRFDEIKEALNHWDLILFLPITKDYDMEYSEKILNTGS